MEREISLSKQLTKLNPSDFRSLFRGMEHVIDSPDFKPTLESLEMETDYGVVKLDHQDFSFSYSGYRHRVHSVQDMLNELKLIRGLDKLRSQNIFKFNSKTIHTILASESV